MYEYVHRFLLFMHAQDSLAEELIEDPIRGIIYLYIPCLSQ